MAKIRVYELAKKLNMTNKALLTKLKAMNIEAKSHMSSLEDDTEARVRENMFGQKNKQADTRVKSSVIRRRKPKKNETSNRASDIRSTEIKDKAEAMDESPASSETSTIPEIKNSKPEVSHEQPSDSEEKIDARQKSSQGKKTGEMSLKRSESKPKKKLRRAKSEPAKVILRPEQPVKIIQDVQKNVPEVKPEVKKDFRAEDAPMVEKAQENLKEGKMEQPTKDADTGKTPEAKHEPAEKALEKEPQSKQEETALEAKKVHEEVLTPEVNPAEKSMDLSELQSDPLGDSAGDSAGDSSGQSTTESATEPKDRKRKKKKPQKRSEPAKIIKMAVPIPKPVKTVAQKGSG